MPRPIAIVTPRYAPDIGGVERHVEALAVGLAGKGIPIEVLTTDPSRRRPRVERRDGVVVRRFPTLAGEGTYFISPRMLRWAWGRGEDYRLVHAHNYQSLVPLTAAVGAWRADIPLVITPHYHAAGHTPFRALLHRPYRPIAHRMMHRAATVIAVSEAERGWLARDFGLQNLAVLPNGVDLAPDGALATAATVAPHPGITTLLSVGRLEAYKGVERIVTALPCLPSTTQLVIIGKGSAADAIARTAERLGVTDRVRLLGHVSAAELHAWYATADLFVSLSREEAFGMTLLEAAAGGAPVLASDIPAHREVRGFVRPERIALVDQGIEGEPLAHAITAGLAVGRSTDREGWRLPTWEAMADGVAHIYAQALGEPIS